MRSSAVAVMRLSSELKWKASVGCGEVRWSGWCGSEGRRCARTKVLVGLLLINSCLPTSITATARHFEMVKFKHGSRVWITVDGKELEEYAPKLKEEKGSDPDRRTVCECFAADLCASHPDPFALPHRHRYGEGQGVHSSLSDCKVTRPGQSRGGVRRPGQGSQPCFGREPFRQGLDVPRLEDRGSVAHVHFQCNRHKRGCVKPSKKTLAAQRTDDPLRLQSVSKDHSKSSWAS